MRRPTKFTRALHRFSPFFSARDQVKYAQQPSVTVNAATTKFIYVINTLYILHHHERSSTGVGGAFEAGTLTCTGVETAVRSLQYYNYDAFLMPTCDLVHSLPFVTSAFRHTASWNKARHTALGHAFRAAGRNHIRVNMNTLLSHRA